MSAMRNDPNGGANAAQTIYNNERTVCLQGLSVPLPSWAWLSNVLEQLWDVFVALPHQGLAFFSVLTSQTVQKLGIFTGGPEMMSRWIHKLALA